MEMRSVMPQLHPHYPKVTYLEDMSRDLQSPLRKLMGHAEYIFTRSDDPMVKYSAKMVFEKSFQILGHVRNALDLSDMASGQFELQRDHFNLSGLLSGLVHEFQGDATERGLCLKLHFDNRIPPLVYMDPKRLRSVLSHLLNDCLKYTPQQGQVQLSVVLVEQSREILFVLKNDEHSQSQHGHTNALEESYSSTCHTMAAQLVDQLITRMGGRIQYASTSESGQICYFSLPLHTHLKIV
jgi:signal transduction histidine kinase